MQRLARPGFTEAEVRSLLVDPSIEVDFGADLLVGTAGAEDITEYVAGGSVERSNFAKIHGTCSLELLTDLEWGADRVRPWMDVSAGGRTARFYLGVYVLTAPDEEAPNSPRIRTVQGYDVLWFLDRPAGDTYVHSGNIDVGLEDVFYAQAGLSGTSWRWSGDGIFKAPDHPMVWALAENNQATWLGVANDLLGSVGYRGLWADERGVLRVEPYRPPDERPTEWEFDLADRRTNIVGEDRTYSADADKGPNWWRFVRRGMSRQPVENDGIYTVDRSAGVSRRPAEVRYLDAADQDSLVAQGDAVVTDETTWARTLEIETDPLPVAGHFDVVSYRDPALNLSVRCQARSWSLPLDGSPMRWTLEVL